MKIKILKFFNLQKIEIVKPLDLDKIFEKHKEYFQTLFIKDFVGYIPKEINEPTLKIFEDNAEMFERWTLWQSYYINRKMMSEPAKGLLYTGMLIYLKLLNSVARVNKKNYVPSQKQTNTNTEVKPAVEDLLKDVAYFRENHGKPIQAPENKGNSSKDS